MKRRSQSVHISRAIPKSTKVVHSARKIRENFAEKAKVRMGMSVTPTPAPKVRLRKPLPNAAKMRSDHSRGEKSNIIYSHKSRMAAMVAKVRRPMLNAFCEIRSSNFFPIHPPTNASGRVSTATPNIVQFASPPMK